MLRSLLADRFHLAFHRETREMQVYELAVAKGGSKLREVDPPAHGLGGSRPTAPGLIHIGKDSTNIATLASRPDVILLRRPVVDKTGLKGIYEIDFEYQQVEPTPQQKRNGHSARRSEYLRCAGEDPRPQTGGAQRPRRSPGSRPPGHDSSIIILPDIHPASPRSAVKQRIERFRSTPGLRHLQSPNVLQPILRPHRNRRIPAPNQNQIHRQARRSSIAIVERMNTHQTPMRGESRIRGIRRPTEPRRKITH